jgi:hypothetical protein
MIFLDSVTPGVEISATSADFVSDFEAEYGEAPIYTAGTYDAVLGLVEAIEGTGSLDTDGIIAWMEDVANVRVTAGGTGGYYPVWDGSTEGANLLGAGTVPALNEAQVLELYPWLATAKYSDGASLSDWTYNPDDWTMPPHTTHDQVYGSQWIHGVASQWQDVDGTLQKIGVWPTVLNPALPTTLDAWLGAVGAGAIDAPTMYALQGAGLWDKYGWWNFAYTGAGSLQLTDWVMWLATK